MINNPPQTEVKDVDRSYVEETDDLMIIYVSPTRKSTQYDLMNRDENLVFEGILIVESGHVKTVFKKLPGYDSSKKLVTNYLGNDSIHRSGWDSEFTQSLLDGCLDGRNPLVTPREVNPAIANKWEGWEEWPGRQNDT